MTENHSNAMDVRKHIKSYLAIVAALIGLTLVSVGISRLGLPVGVRVAAGLTIAIVQGILSVGYLMHLNWEKRFVYGVLILTVFFFAALLSLPLLSYFDAVGFSHVP